MTVLWTWERPMLTAKVMLSMTLSHTRCHRFHLSTDDGGRTRKSGWKNTQAAHLSAACPDDLLTVSCAVFLYQMENALCSFIAGYRCNELQFFKCIRRGQLWEPAPTEQNHRNFWSWNSFVSQFIHVSIATFLADFGEFRLIQFMFHPH